MSVTLQKISVSGFKSIREMELELRSLNVLIGANGAGKSNFLDVFRLLNAMVDGRLQSYSGRENVASLLYFGPKVTERISIQVNVENLLYDATLVLTKRNSLSFVRERARISSEEGKDYASVGEHSESFLNYGEPILKNTDAVRAMKDFRVNHFQDTSPEARVKQTRNVDDNRYLRPDGANLAAFLYLLQERYAPFYDRIVRTVRLIAPFFDTFVLTRDRLNPDMIRLEWRERGSDEYFNAHMLSDGTLRFICLATLLLQPEPPSLILIDEPELGLHPYALNYLAGMIRSVSTQTQMIISTQSVPLINQFDPEAIITVDREDNQSIFKRLSAEVLNDWLEEYSLGELWEKNILGGTP